MLPATLALPSGPVGLRRAGPEDVEAIVALLAADPLAATRERPEDPEPYRRAFAAVDADPGQLLLAADAAGEGVGTLQLSFIPGLSRRGMLRAQIEAVRVRDDHRGGGLGTAMLEWAIAEAGRRGCGLVQLTTDRTRPEALRVYERLGFVASHVGLKLPL